jgi:hypothetical protein
MVFVCVIDFNQHVDGVDEKETYLEEGEVNRTILFRSFVIATFINSLAIQGKYKM